MYLPLILGGIGLLVGHAIESRKNTDQKDDEKPVDKTKKKADPKKVDKKDNTGDNAG